MSRKKRKPEWAAQPHPTRYRWTIAVLTGVAVLFGSGIASKMTAETHPRLAHVLEVIAVSVLIGGGILTLFIANATRCPQCRKILFRPRRTTDFACPKCRVVWTTTDRTN